MIQTKVEQTNIEQEMGNITGQKRWCKWRTILPVLKQTLVLLLPSCQITERPTRHQLLHYCKMSV